MVMNENEEYIMKIEEELKLQEDEKNEIKILNMHCETEIKELQKNKKKN